MKVLALSRPLTRPLSDLAPYLEEEARAVWSMSMEAVVREQYVRDDGGIVLILECQDLSTAVLQLGRLPLVARGLLEFDAWALAPFSPWNRLLGP
jgi:hypothetical protein